MILALIIASTMLVEAAFFWRRARIHPLVTVGVSAALAAAGLVVGHAAHIALHLTQYGADPWRLLRIWDGAHAPAALVGVLLGCGALLLSPRSSALPDLYAPFVWLALAFVRVDCVVSGCCEGVALIYLAFCCYLASECFAAADRAWDGEAMLGSLFVYGLGSLAIEFLRVERQPGLMLAAASLAAASMGLAYYLGRRRNSTSLTARSCPT